MRSLRAAAMVLPVAAVLLLGGCGYGPRGDSIEGVWNLESASDGSGELEMTGQPVTLEIDGKKASGQGPCNSYSTEVTQRGDSVNFGLIASTQMFCEDGADFEGQYFAALDTVTTAEVDGDSLTLTGPGVELVYERDIDTSGTDPEDYPDPDPDDSY